MDKQLDTSRITRRTVVATGLVTGFTLAAGPLNAAAIVTNATGLDAGEVSIPVSDGKIPGYRARPSGKANLPMIIVVQEIFGVHEHIKDVCRRLAHLGYYAVAPSLYARYGDPGKYDMSTVKNLMTDIVAKVPDVEVMSDLDSAVAFAAGEGANTAKLGITGFCWGGRITWLYAAHNPKLNAAVAWYGPLRGPVPPNPLRPQYPLDLAGDINVPVLGLYGGLDTGIGVSNMEDMKAALAGAGKLKSKIEIFMDAQHGFFADYRASYNEKDAKQGWAEALAWFKKNGVA